MRKISRKNSIFSEDCITNLRLFTNLGGRVLGPFGHLNPASLEYYQKSSPTSYDGEYEAHFTNNWLQSLIIGQSHRPVAFSGERKIGPSERVSTKISTYRSGLHPCFALGFGQSQNSSHMNSPPRLAEAVRKDPDHMQTKPMVFITKCFYIGRKKTIMLRSNPLFSTCGTPKSQKRHFKALIFAVRLKQPDGP